MSLSAFKASFPSHHARATAIAMALMAMTVLSPVHGKHRPALAVAQEGPGGGTFIPGGSCANPRCPDGGMAVLGNGKVLAVSTHLADPHPVFEIYDPASGRWAPAGPCEDCGFSGFTLTHLPAGPPSMCGPNCGKALLTGGMVRLTAGDDHADVVSAKTFLFDPNANGGTGAWTAAAPMTTPRRSHTATLLPSGKVLVAGGCEGGQLGDRIHCYEGSPPTATTELYDPLTGNWERTGAMGVARYRHTATLIDQGRVLVAGGSPGERNESAGLDSTELYDVATGRWAPEASMSAPTSKHTATLLENGDVLVAGGWNGGPLSSAELYDVRSAKWEPAGILASPRDSHAATNLNDGRVLVVGGVQGGDRSGEVYDRQKGRWEPAGALLRRGLNHGVSVVALPRGPISVCGDNCGKALIVATSHGQETWLYAPSSFVSEERAAVPGGKERAAVPGGGSDGVPLSAVAWLLGGIVVAAVVWGLARRQSSAGNRTR